MVISSNRKPPDPIDTETIRSWYTAGYLEGLMAGYTNTEPEYLNDILVQPELFVPMVEGLDNVQHEILLNTFNSINSEDLGRGPGEFLRRRMAKFWGYLRSIQLDK